MTLQSYRGWLKLPRLWGSARAFGTLDKDPQDLAIAIQRFQEAVDTRHDWSVKQINLNGKDDKEVIELFYAIVLIVGTLWSREAVIIAGTNKADGSNGSEPTIAEGNEETKVQGHLL